MTIAVAHFVFNLTTYSGAARQALALADHMDGVRSLFFNVEAGRDTVEQSTLEGHEVVHLPPRRLVSYRTVWIRTRQERLSVYHLHGLIGVGLLGGIALRMPLVLKTTLLGSDDFDSLRERLHGWGIMRLVARVDANVVLSGAMQSINRRYLPPERVHRLPNAARLPPTWSGKTAPRFVVVGLVCHRKRTREAIEFFLEAYSGLEGAVLHVIGPAGDDYGLNEGDPSYLASCQAMVPADHAEQVVFTGALSRAELDEYYRDALGFISLSESEGMPNAMLEAMASNCVPITGEIGGVAAEIVEDRRDGFIVTAGVQAPDIEAVRALSATGAPRNRIEAEFSLPALGRRYEQLYRSLL